MRSNYLFLVLWIVGPLAWATLAGCGDDKPSGGKGDQSKSTEREAAGDSNKIARATPPSGKDASVGNDDKNPGQSAGEPWGDLKVRFVYEGSPPQPDKLKVDKDRSVCTKNHPVDESLLVDPQSNGIANVVMWMYFTSSDKRPAAHPSYAQTADENVDLVNHDCRFEPHVTLMRTGQTLVVRNADPVGHNTKVDLPSDPTGGFNIQVGPGEAREVPIEHAERVPIPVSCGAHSWMSGYLVIKDHPYFAKSDKDGNLLIENIPTGIWKFQIHHPQMGYGRNLEVAGASTDSRRGVVEVEIVSGMNDLGEIRIPAEKFDD